MEQVIPPFEKGCPVFRKWRTEGNYSEHNARFTGLSLELFTCSKTFGCCAPFTLDLMVDQQKYNTYREQAVDTIALALDSSLLDEKVRVTCCRALLILGGRISFSGMVMTEDWILKKSGFLDGPELEVQEDEVPMKDNIFSNSSIIHECKEEEVAVNDWLMKISASLLGDRKKSFLYSISRCLKSGDRDITRGLLDDNGMVEFYTCFFT